MDQKFTSKHQIVRFNEISNLKDGLSFCCGQRLYNYRFRNNQTLPVDPVPIKHNDGIGIIETCKWSILTYNTKSCIVGMHTCKEVQPLLSRLNMRK